MWSNELDLFVRQYHSKEKHCFYTRDLIDKGRCLLTPILWWSKSINEALKARLENKIEEGVIFTGSDSARAVVHL